MTLNYKNFYEGRNGYRSGTLNVQINGIQIEDLYREWVARSQECEKLRKKVSFQNEMLTKQGKYIEELKEKIKDADK